MTWLTQEQKDLFKLVFDEYSILPRNRKGSLKLRNLSFFSTDTKSIKQMVPYIVQLNEGQDLSTNQYYNALKNSGLIEKNNEINEFGEMFLEFLFQNEREAYNNIISQRDTRKIDEKYILPLELIVLLAVYTKKTQNNDLNLASFEIIDNLNYLRTNISDSLSEYEQRNFDIRDVLQYEDEDFFLMLQGINYQGYEVKRLIHLRDQITNFKDYYIEAYETCPDDDNSISADEINYFEQIRYFKNQYQKDNRFRVRMTFYLSLILEGIVFPEILSSFVFTSIEEKEEFIISNGLKPIIEEYKELLDRYYKQNKEKPLTFKTGYQSNYLHNRILFGAPGTGKSYKLKNDLEELMKNGGYYERVTFHPEYTYSNFVGTYKPVPRIKENNENEITYDFVPGPFMRVYVEALKNIKSDNPKPNLLIIEEINRANVAAVFGEVFQLLDRDGNSVSEYPIQPSEDIKKYLQETVGSEFEDITEIKIPDNMFIWATMNNADQGVLPLDTAFKRRWDFEYLDTDSEESQIEGNYVVVGKGTNARRVEWNKLRKAINNRLSELNVNEDKLLGTFFVNKRIVVPENGHEIDADNFNSMFKHKVLMYLFEDVVKQNPKSLFENCSNAKRYSYICREFDELGIGIFGSSITSEFPTITNGGQPEDTDIESTEGFE